MSDATSLFDWVFRNRQTGRVTVAQFPNPALVVFGVGVVLARWRAGTDVGRVGEIIAATALAVWALDELVRGVNPWRRVLGGCVLAWQTWTLLRG